MNSSPLLTYRTQIDEIDRQIINLIKQRFEVVKKISKVKKQHSLPALDQARWQAVLADKKNLAQKLGLNPQLIEEIYELIHQESLDLQK